MVRLAGRTTIVVAALALLWSSASAATRPKPVGISVFGSFHTYDMADVNAAIGTPGTILPGVSGAGDKIESGAGFGGGLRVWPSDRLLLAIDFARLLGKSTGTGTYLGFAYDGEVDVPATSLTATVGWFFLPFPRARLGLGAGAGYYVCTGEVSVGNALGTYSADVEGSGFGFHGLALADIALAGPLHVEAGAGYRYARTTDVTIEGLQMHNADGSDARVDWSGLTTRLGVTLYLTRERPQ